MKLIRKIAHGLAWRIKKLLRPLRRLATFGYKTLTLHHIYPSAYKKYAEKPVIPGKVVFLEIRMKELTDDFRLIYEELKKDPGYDLRVCHIGMGLESAAAQHKNCMAALWEIAQAGIVFISDSSSLISCIPLRPQTKVIQVWHACGAFKKFGYSTADKIFGGTKEQLDRFPYHKNFSLVTVSSPEVVWAYAEAFHMEDRREDILPIGVSRTDVFYDPEAIGAAREKVCGLMPESRGKRIILYAPTFRGRVAHAMAPQELDLAAMERALGSEYVLLIKHHPFVKQRPQIPQELLGFARDVTGELSIEELLMASDICVSDYSSLVFEYSLFERPMFFFAYDLEDYYDWRGFYYPYEEMAPGPVVRTTEELLDCIGNLEGSFDRKRVVAFREKFMSACDGHATRRIVGLVEAWRKELTAGIIRGLK